MNTSEFGEKSLEIEKIIAMIDHIKQYAGMTNKPALGLQRYVLYREGYTVIMDEKRIFDNGRTINTKGRKVNIDILFNGEPIGNISLEETIQKFDEMQFGEDDVVLGTSPVEKKCNVCEIDGKTMSEAQLLNLIEDLIQKAGNKTPEDIHDVLTALPKEE